jgi:hypothetical protein
MAAMLEFKPVAQCLAGLPPQQAAVFVGTIFGTPPINLKRSVRRRIHFDPLQTTGKQQ